jgi:hypothetical protein
MPANQFGVDLGEAITTGQNIAKNSLVLQKAQKEVDTQNSLTKARQRLASGDQSAMQDMLVLSPEETQKYAAAIGQMDENQRKNTEQSLHSMGAAAATVLHSDDPERTYQYMKTQFPQETTANWPQNYDQNWTTFHLAQAKDGMTLLKSTYAPPKKVTVGTKDYLYGPDGKLITTATSGEQSRHEDTQKMEQQKIDQQKGALKTADEGLMNKEVSQSFGGMYNPTTGEIKFSDPKSGQKAQEITAKAVDIFQKGGGKISRSEAVRQAMAGPSSPPAPGKPSGNAMQNIKPFMP